MSNTNAEKTVRVIRSGADGKVKIMRVAASRDVGTGPKVTAHWVKVTC